MKYKMCASVAQKTPRSANTVLCKALKICDYAELRLDFLKPKDVPKVLELSKSATLKNSMHPTAKIRGRCL